MSAFELPREQGRQLQKGILYLERHPNAPTHEAVSIIVSMCPSLDFALLEIIFSDWLTFRLESPAEVSSMIEVALRRRGATA